MATRRLVVELVGDDRSLSRTLGRSEKQMGKFGAAAKKAGLGLAAGLGVGTAAAAKEAREAAKVSRQTDAVLKSTGGVAKVSKKQIEDLADAISLKAGVDDEAVQSGQNLLLTFKNIRNEAGASDTFKRTAKAAVDMSAAMNAAGKSMSIADAMLQLGKAVNDPEKGMTRLMRSGVDFTNQQKEQVKALVASGQTVKAQAVILREVEAQFGGSAAANADGMDRLKVAFNNLLETIGGPLNTAMNKASTYLAGFITQVRTGTGAGGRFRETMTGVATNIQSVGRALAPVAQVFAGLAGKILGSKTAMSALAAVAAGLVVRIVALKVASAAAAALALLTRALAAVRVALLVLRAPLLAITLLMARNPFVIAATALAALGAALVVAYKKSDTFRRVVDRAFDVLKAAVRGFVAVTKAQLDTWRDVLTGIGRAASRVFNGIKKVVGDVIAGMLRRFATLFDVAAKIPGIGGKFKGLADRARDAANRIDGVGEATNKLDGKKVNVRVRMSFDVPGVGKGLQLPGFGGSGKMIDKGIERATQEFAHSNRSKFAPLFAGETGALGTAKGTLGKYEAIGHKFGLRTTSGHRPGDSGYHGQNRARDLSDGVNTPGMMRYARHLSSKYGSKLLELIYTPLGYGIKHGKKVPLSYWGSRVNAMHHNHVHVAAQRGSMVPGSGSGDKVRALLEPGEGIINRKAVAAMGGKAAIDKINQAVPRFQSGGLVQAARKYFKGNTLRTMLAIAMAESGGRLKAHNTKGEDSRGPWQINVGPGANTDLRGMNLFSWMGNAKAARIVLNRQGLGAWTMYSNRTYRQFLDDADRALKGGGGRSPGGKAPKKRDTRPFIRGDVERLNRKGGRGRARRTPRLGKLPPQVAAGPYHFPGSGAGLAADVVAEAGPTRSDYLDAAVARAGLTATATDDIAALKAIVDFRQKEWDLAKKSSDPRIVKAAAEALDQARDSWMQASTAAAQAALDVAEAVREQAVAAKEAARVFRENTLLAEQAQARLTVTTDDDIAATKALLALREEEYQALMEQAAARQALIDAGGAVGGELSGFVEAVDPAKLANAADALKDAQDAVEALKKSEEEKAAAAAEAAKQLIEDTHNAALAQAQLTETKDDDIAATKALLALREAEYAAAVASNDPKLIIDAANELRQVRDALEGLNSAVAEATEAEKAAAEAAAQAAADQAKALEDHTQALKSLKETMDRANAFSESITAINAREALTFMGNMISGQIGATYSGRRRTAGDGTLLARS